MQHKTATIHGLVSGLSQFVPIGGAQHDLVCSRAIGGVQGDHKVY